MKKIDTIVIAVHAWFNSGLWWSFFPFAVTANPKKIQAVTQYFKAGFFGGIRIYILQEAQIRIDYLFALHTDDMRMGKVVDILST